MLADSLTDVIRGTRRTLLYVDVLEGFSNGRGNLVANTGDGLVCETISTALVGSSVVWEDEETKGHRKSTNLDGAQTQLLFATKGHVEV